MALVYSTVYYISLQEQPPILSVDRLCDGPYVGYPVQVVQYVLRRVSIALTSTSYSHNLLYRGAAQRLIARKGEIVS